MQSEQTIKLYQSKIQSLPSEFPLEEHELLSKHNQIIKEITSFDSLDVLTSSVKRQINNEFVKLQKQNEEKYSLILNEFLNKEFQEIEDNVASKRYIKIEDYITDIRDFVKSCLNRAPEGPKKETFINQFVYDSLQRQTDEVLQNLTRDMSDGLKDKKDEMDRIKDEISQARNEAQKLQVAIKEHENLIRNAEDERSDLLKRTTSNADKISRLLKTKNEEISKINKEIEDIESKNSRLVEELKDKIKQAEKSRELKDQSVKGIETEFEQQKIELESKVQLLETKIKNCNEARAQALQNLTQDLFASSQSSEIKKFEDQINALNKKIEKLQAKNNSLSEELFEKDKQLENEQLKSQQIMAEYEKKIRLANDEHETIEEKAKKAQENEQQMLTDCKANYETLIAETKADFSKKELITKNNIDKLTEQTNKTNEDLKNLRDVFGKCKAKLEEIKSQSNKDKTDYNEYVRILEENHKRILSQYDESVKENNNLKAQQQADIIRMNGQTEKNLIQFQKDNESILSEIDRKKNEYEKQFKILQGKLQDLESKEIPDLEKEEAKLRKEISDIQSRASELNIQFQPEEQNIREEHETELQKLRQQLEDDLDKNKLCLQNNLDFAQKECEQQKEELLSKIKENQEINRKNQQDLINMFNEKLLILEQTKDEKIEECNNEINEIKTAHNDYIEQTDEELMNTEQQIDDLNNEMKEANDILNNIQVKYEEIVKKNKEDFTAERNRLEEIIEELLQRYNQTYVHLNLIQKQSNNYQENANDDGDLLEKLKAELNEIKARHEKITEALEAEIKNITIDLVNLKSDGEQSLAVKNQEIDFIQNEMNEKKDELEKFQKTYEEKINECRNELIEKFSKDISDLEKDRETLDNELRKKQKEYKEEEINFFSNINLLKKEKEVLSEKVRNTTTQITEIKNNLVIEKENNSSKVDSAKKELKDNYDQLLKENEILKNRLEELQAEYDDISDVYTKDKTLWENKYNHKVTDKENVENELADFKKKYQDNIDGLNLKLQDDRINLQQIYNDAIMKRDEKFNTQINNANKYFAQKFEYINNLNQTLTIKNKELIETLNNFENLYNTKDKEAKLMVILQSNERLRQDINSITNSKDAEIEALKNKLLAQRKAFTNKMIELQNKLREQEMKRTTFSAHALKQNVNSEKNTDEQSNQIIRLRNEIAQLEKANFRLRIENRDATKDNKTLRRRSRERETTNSSYGYIPRSTRNLAYAGKENNRAQSNLVPENVSEQRKNLMENLNKKFNAEEEHDDFVPSENSGRDSLIINASDIEDNGK